MKFALILSLFSISAFSVESNCSYFLNVKSPVQEGYRAALIENTMNIMATKNYEITPDLSQAKYLVTVSTDIAKEGRSFVFDVNAVVESVNSDVRKSYNANAKNMKLAVEAVIANIEECK